MMFGFGFIMMLVVIGLPVILIIAVVWGLTRRSGNVQPPLSTTAPAHSCQHCGAGLQTGWTHCPQCGAPVDPIAKGNMK